MTLEVENLFFAYASHQVLKGIDVKAQAGQCICLLGANGAGKTTLLRCILGLLSGFKGRVLLGGEDVKSLSARLLAKKIAYIPQAHSPVFNYTVFDTVLMGAGAGMNAFGSPGNKERETARSMLEKLCITHLSGRGYAEISGGERQLVLIARALAQQTRILVMDEPTANLDYGNRLRVLRHIKELTGQGYLVVFSTHDPQCALQYADTALVLKDGRAAICGAPEEVLTPQVIESVYGVAVERRDVDMPWGSVGVFIPDERKAN